MNRKKGNIILERGLCAMPAWASLLKAKLPGWLVRILPLSMVVLGTKQPACLSNSIQECSVYIDIPKFMTCHNFRQYH